MPNNHPKLGPFILSVLQRLCVLFWVAFVEIVNVAFQLIVLLGGLILGYQALKQGNAVNFVCALIPATLYFSCKTLQAKQVYWKFNTVSNN